MRFVQRIRPNSLRAKLLLAYLASMLLSVLLVLIVAVLMFQSNDLARVDLAGATEDLAEKIRFDAAGRPVGFDASMEDLAWLYQSPQRETAYRILDAKGEVALISQAGSSFWPRDDLPLQPGSFAFEHDELTIHGATEVVLHQGKQWYLQFAASTRFMQLIHRIALPLVFTGIGVFSLVLLLAFAVFAYITLRFTLQPLTAVSESAAAISPRCLQSRLQTDAVPAEIAPLVQSFNRALERLEHGYRVQKEFLGNAAHELKTPLALIRAQIELADVQPQERQALLQDVQYMSRQVQQLLLLAEVSEVRNYQFEAVEVQEVVEEVVLYLQRMAQSAGVSVRINGPSTTWHADRGAFFTLLKNLLENAIQHSPKGREIVVTIAPATLSVRDFGPGLAPEQIARLFERFWRGPERRDLGAGLGLAICQEIALTHGWKLSAENAVPGMCFCVRIKDVKATGREIE